MKIGEERGESGEGVPGWILRYVYRPLIRTTATRFRKAMANYKNT